MGFTLFFLIPQQHTQQRTGDATANMPPIIDARNKEAEYEKSDGPRTDLPVNDLTIYTAATLTVIKYCPDQAAYGRRCTNCERDSGQITHQETGCSANSIDDEHAVGTKLSHSKRCELGKGGHVEKNVQDTTV